jgi:hypothetical protein
VLELRDYFNGTLDAYGIFTDRSGKVVKRFTVVMDCTWQGDSGVLDEAFHLFRRQHPAARLAAHAPCGRPLQRPGRRCGGHAQGQQSGNAFHWTYTLALPVDGRVIEVQFDDWMFLMNDKVMLNKAAMRKWGVEPG